MKLGTGCGASDELGGMGDSEDFELRVRGMIR